MTGKEHRDAVLNDIEKAELSKIADNVTALGALQKLFLMGIYFEGTIRKDEQPNPTRNFLLAAANGKDAASNEQLGQIVRAQAEGVGLLELGFNYLAQYKTPEPQAVDNQSNPGR